MPVERGGAHARQPGKPLHTQGLVEVRPDPRDRLADLAEAAVRPCDLPQRAALRPLEQPVKHLALVHRREHRRVVRRVEQRQQP